MSLTFQLGISSVDAITILPEYSSAFGETQLRSEILTQAGRRYIYKWGDYDQIKLDVDYISANNASIINSWWDTNTELLFFINSGEPLGGGIISEVHSVFIANKTKPLTKYVKPYDDYLKGSITLEGY